MQPGPKATLRTKSGQITPTRGARSPRPEPEHISRGELGNIISRQPVLPERIQVQYRFQLVSADLAACEDHAAVAWIFRSGSEKNTLRILPVQKIPMRLEMPLDLLREACCKSG